MYYEEFVEEGIVTDVNNGTANVNLAQTDACHECAAKLFCKPKKDDERSLTVKDPFGVHPGDKVRIAIKGSNILLATFNLYGIPLLLLLAGIFFGMNFFSSNAELFSSLLGLTLSSIYLFFLFFGAKIKKIKNKSLPIITFVSTKLQQNH